MRHYVRSGLIASIVAGLAAVAGAQTPSTKTGTPAGPATKAAVPPRPPLLDQVLATVNGKPIIREELIRFLNAVGVPEGADNEQDIYRVGMENLVNHELVKQYLQKQKALDVTEKEVDAEFAEAGKKFKETGEDFTVALASHGISLAKYREDTKDILRWKKYLEAVCTDANLKKFVADNKDAFNQAQVRASHIVIRADPDAPAAEKEKARQKIAAIKSQIDSGKITFADAANKYSEDDGNKASPSGGDLGFFVRRGQFNEQFTAAAFALKKGVVSDPVETPFGYHLIVLTDRKEGTPIDFEAKKLFIRSEYSADLTERIVAAERKTAKIDIKPMPTDLFPKAPPQQPGAVPGQPAKTATPPGNALPK